MRFTCPVLAVGHSLRTAAAMSAVACASAEKGGVDRVRSPSLSRAWPQTVCGTSLQSALPPVEYTPPCVTYRPSPLLLDSITDINSIQAMGSAPCNRLAGQMSLQLSMPPSYQTCHGAQHQLLWFCAYIYVGRGFHSRHSHAVQQLKASSSWHLQ